MPFKLITDNQALSFVLNTKRKVGRLSRWVERLLDLPYTVEFRKSKDNPIADYLSRMYNEEDKKGEIHEENPEEIPIHNQNLVYSNLNNIVCTDKTIIVNNCVEKNVNRISHNQQNIPPVNHVKSEKCKVNQLNVINDIPLAFTDLSKHQADDEECKRIIHSVINKTNKENYFLKDNVLMYKTGKNKSKIYLPRKLINLIFQFYHSGILGGHLGIMKTQEKINEYFYYPNLNNVIKEKVKQCKICMQSKSAQRHFEGKLVSNPVNNALDTIFLDTFGPLPRSKQMNQYILIAVDAFSKFVWLYPIRDCKSKQIIDKLNGCIFNSFGMPRTIVSDNATYFVSNEFKKFTFSNYITHRTIVPYRAASNLSERYLRNLGNMLRSYYHNCQNMWDKDIGYIEISLNTAKNTSTGETPFNLMFNHDCNNGLSNLWHINELVSEKKSKEEKCQTLTRAIQNVKKSVLLNNRRKKYLFPKSKHPFKIGSLVYVKTHILSNKQKQICKKLSPKYIGPYRIIYFLSDVTVMIESISIPRTFKRAHIIDLKLYSQEQQQKPVLPTTR